MVEINSGKERYLVFDIIRYLAIICLVIFPILITPEGLQLTVKNSFVNSDIMLINIFRVISIIIGILLIFFKKIKEFIDKKTSNIPIEAKILITIIGIMTTFAFLHLMTLDSNVLNYYFYLDGEYTIPSWFSTVLLFAIALLSFITASIIKDNHYQKKFWSFFSVLAVFLSLDEAVQIHESLTRRLSIEHWFYVGAPIILIVFVAIVYITIKSNMDKNIRNTLFLGIILAVIGAVGFEYIGRHILEEGSIYYNIEVLIEECFELLGGGTIIYALTKNIRIKQENTNMINVITDKPATSPVDAEK
jgi:hypothetical protein